MQLTHTFTQSLAVPIKTLLIISLLTQLSMEVVLLLWLNWEAPILASLFLGKEYLSVFFYSKLLILIFKEIK